MFSKRGARRFSTVSVDKQQYKNYDSTQEVRNVYGPTESLSRTCKKQPGNEQEKKKKKNVISVVIRIFLLFNLTDTQQVTSEECESIIMGLCSLFSTGCGVVKGLSANSGDLETLNNNTT